VPETLADHRDSDPGSSTAVCLQTAQLELRATEPDAVNPAAPRRRRVVAEHGYAV